uniref:Probable dethiobiotin synthetase n=1 Tax=Leptospirillum ferrodiazotrophum TaxID=412449 RepID=C6HTS5_9BACT|nr:MAG: probable dethiobiotin synthetase [Leptospirillum ferrodiazotrophum]
MTFFPPEAPSRSLLFVLATDTEVGKTRVMESLVRTHRDQPDLLYVKVAQTGVGALPGPPEDRDILRYLAAGADPSAVWELESFREPLDPMTAARLEGRSLDRKALAARLRSAAESGHRVVVEGSGGVLSPFFDDGEGILSLIRAIGLPSRILLVSHPHLGTLSATLAAVRILTLEGFPPEALLLCPRSGVHDRAGLFNPRTLARLLSPLPVHLENERKEWQQVEP